MRAALWFVLSVVFGLATVGGIAAGIQAMSAADTAGAQSTFGVATGAGDAALRVGLIVVCALLTRACWRRGVGNDGSQPVKDLPHKERRPWER